MISHVGRAENLVREAYMRRRIEETIASGHKPEKIAAVVGAFHQTVLTGEFPAMTDQELASLRRRTSKLTLMPYSYFRLSSQSGTEGGNLMGPLTSNCSGRPSTNRASAICRGVTCRWSLAYCARPALIVRRPR